MNTLKRAIVPIIIGCLVIAAAVVMFGGGSSDRTLTAYFPRALSIYEGSEVTVLGVPVGTVTEIEPEGTQVKVTMTYDGDVKFPADASAAVIAPSIVGDRFVQIFPAYKEGDKRLPENAVLKVDRTEVPLELDEIYASLDELTVALGPNGANSQGALSDLLATTAENFGGQGAKFHETIEDFSTLSRTLDNNKEELFGSAEALEGFIKTLADNDGTVRAFNQSLSQVSNLLEGEKEELAASLRNLGVALGEVGSFVKENRSSLGRNIKGLNRVAKVLVKQRGALDEILTTAPLALSNLALAYNPDSGTLDTNANLGNLVSEIESNPAGLLCAAVASNDPTGALCDAITGVLGRPGAFRGRNADYGDPFDPTLNGLVAP